MVKKVFSFVLGLLVASIAMGQSAEKSVNIQESAIQFWVGNGSNSTVVAIGWDDDDASYTPTVVVWGIRWNGSITLLDAIDSIAIHDSRLTYTMSGSFLATLDYNDPAAGVHLSPSGYYNCNNYNGVYGLTALTSTWLRISESTCDNYNFTNVNNLIYASNPNGGTQTDSVVDATIAFSDILWWIGSGSDSAALIVNFAQPDTAFAWGYLFNGSTTAQAMVDSIAAADPRFWTVGTPSYGGDIHFVTGDGDTLGLSPVDPSLGYNFWWTNLNGVSAGAGSASVLHNGDVFKYGDMNSATGWDEMGGYYMEEAWTKAPTPVPAPEDTTETPVEAIIVADAIEFWVGEGVNEAIFVVNWADTALAWGYRFADDSVSMAAMMQAIDAADPRFSYIIEGGMLSDIHFNDGSTTLGITAGNYWSNSVNGFQSAGMNAYLHDGDFTKWADPAAGTLVDVVYIPAWDWYDYIYVYSMTIYPVSQPVGYGPFCGAVGTEGCTAIAFNDSRIKAWATGCTVVRGSQNLSNPNAPAVTYGTESEAVGAASESTMDVVSLGDGGSATLTFDLPIVNGTGYDFVVYENSFSDAFLELAYVEVSSDGVRFVRFPATSLTQTVHQVVSAVDPTYINNLAGKYRVGYGTPFDLEELRDSTGIDLDNITHIRVVDVVGSIDPQYGTYDAFGHLVNDPFPTVSYSAGFDLDGVAVLNQKTVSVDMADRFNMTIAPNPATDRLYVTLTVSDPVDALLYDIQGHLIEKITLHNGTNIVNVSHLNNGVYLLRTAESVHKIVKR